MAMERVVTELRILIVEIQPLHVKSLHCIFEPGKIVIYVSIA